MNNLKNDMKGRSLPKGPKRGKSKDITKEFANLKL